MTDTPRAQFQEPAFWKRALFMLGFWLAYSITEVIIGLVIVVQFVIVLFTGRANDALLGFGNSLSLYVRQILRYVLFNSEHEPFPFSDFPDEPAEGDRWRGAGRSAARDPGVAEEDDDRAPEVRRLRDEPDEPDAERPIAPEPPVV